MTYSICSKYFSIFTQKTLDSNRSIFNSFTFIIKTCFLFDTLIQLNYLHFKIYIRLLMTFLILIISLLPSTTFSRSYSLYSFCIFRISIWKWSQMKKFYSVIRRQIQGCLCQFRCTNRKACNMKLEKFFVYFKTADSIQMKICIWVYNDNSKSGEKLC